MFRYETIYKRLVDFKKVFGRLRNFEPFKEKSRPLKQDSIESSTRINEL